MRKLTLLSQQKTMFSISTVALLSLVISGCVTYTNPQRFGTYTYKGKQYDVYTVSKSRDDYVLHEERIRILVPQGTDPSKLRKINPIATCSAEYSRKTCEREFGIALEKRLNPRVEDSSSDY